jgi:hypothetical protein
VGRAVVAVFRSLFDFFEALAEGIAAAHLYENLSRLDDSGLRELGITREEIGRYVVESMGRRSRQEEVALPAAALSMVDGGHGEPAAQPDEPLPHRRSA